MDPGVAPYAADGVEAEELVGLPFMFDSVLREDGPLVVVLLPVAEFHVERPVERLVVHLGVEPLAVRHRALPLGAAWRDRHLSVSCYVLSILLSSYGQRHRFPL